MWWTPLLAYAFVANDPETIYDAARYVDSLPYPAWAPSAKLLGGCVANDNPLTVRLEYAHRNDGVKRVELFRPWRTFGWMVNTDESENREEENYCGSDAFVTTDGRARNVEAAARESWRAYVDHATTPTGRGYDTLRPISHTGIDDYGGMAITAIDALDTLWMMGLHKEFDEACAIVNRTLSDEGVPSSGYRSDTKVNVFETTIRALGGFLGAHALTHLPFLLEYAVDLGDRLLPAFTDTYLPRSDVNLVTRESADPAWGTSSLSETSLTLEFKHLSAVSGDMRFAEAVDDVDERLRRAAAQHNHLLPVFARASDASFSGPVTLGARGDSYYEYLLKEYVRSRDTRYRDAFVAAAERIVAELVHELDESSAFIGELPHGRDGGGGGGGGGNLSLKMDHLVCFLPGVFALAIYHNVLPLDPYLGLARRVMHTCYRMHATTLGLAPEITKVRDDGQLVIDARDRHNLLRPETLESLYVLHRVTGDEVYRDWAWDVWKAFVEHARLDDGSYACIDDVTRTPPTRRDAMPSYWLAETVKYAWLIFSDTDLLSEWVLNTEAHPLPMYG